MKVILIIFLIPLVLIIEVFMAFAGENKPFKNPVRKIISFGKDKNKNLNYLVMGDSTSAGQGGSYKKGIAYSTAKNLSENYNVKMLNTSVSGATTEDLFFNQLKEGLKFNPDVILISIGANDVTHLTSINNLQKVLNTVLDSLIKDNCNVKIILTASPDMGTILRFSQPLRFLVGLQTKRVNKIFYSQIIKHNLTLAPIAKETSEIFKKNHSFFAEDKFHPNDKGYEVWAKIINRSINEALKNQPKHCK